MVFRAELEAGAGGVYPMTRLPCPGPPSRTSQQNTQLEKNIFILIWNTCGYSSLGLKLSSEGMTDSMSRCRRWFCWYLFILILSAFMNFNHKIAYESARLSLVIFDSDRSCLLAWDKIIGNTLRKKVEILERWILIHIPGCNIVKS